MSVSEKDSNYVRREEFLELIKNTAIDMYNMKRTTDKTLDAVNESRRTLKAMNYKLDRLENK